MDENINHLKKSGAIFFAPQSARALELANAAMQQMKASVFPESLIRFYQTHGGAVLGDACVFPTEDIDRPNRRYALPSIVKINRDLAGFKELRGKTIWGRNQFYWFSADVAGGAYMHDIPTMQVLRKYNGADNLGAAMADCLLAGKL